MIPSMWTSLYVELTPEDALRRLASVGFPAVELSTEHLEVLRLCDDRDARLRDFAALAADLGIRMNQAHIALSANICALDSARRHADRMAVLQDIEVLSQLGIQVGVLHPGSYGTPDSPVSRQEELQMKLEAISQMAQAAGAAGVRLALENGCWTLGPEQAVIWEGSARGLRELILQVGSPALGICLDTGHAVLEGWDNAEAVRVAGDLLIATHIADNDGSGDQHRIPYSFGSKVDWPAMAQALKDIRYAGQFNLEIPGERGRRLAILDCAARYGLDVCNRLISGEVGEVLPR